MNIKVIVAHPGQQHSYRLAIALKKRGILLSYMTTVYYKKNSIIMRVLKKVLNEKNVKRAEKRRCSALDDEEVVQYYQIAGLLTLALLRVDKSQRLYNQWNRWVSDAFGRKVARYAIKHKADVVITYDSNASACFKLLKKKAPQIIRVMDVSHANRLYEKQLFEHDMEVLPEWAEMLRKEKKYLWDTDLRFVREEIELTECFLAPSTYVGRSLRFSGIKENQIKINPYGVDVSTFKMRTVQDASGCEHTPPLFFIYVGNVSETKGVGHLLKAFQMVKQKYPDTFIHIVGGDIPEEINSKYDYCAISHGYVQHDEMVKLYQCADVMVFPSLSEGMTLAGLEALCTGVPIICTENSGINDLINDGENGFVIPICSYKRIAETVIWFIEHSERVPVMKVKAYETALNYSWEEYYKRTSNIIEQVFKERAELTKQKSGNQYIGEQ